MIKMLKSFLITSFVSVILLPMTMAQPYDILIKGGHVIDPKNNIDGIMDVAIQNGRIARVSEDIPVAGATSVINAAGRYVTPGLIDIHVHVFYGTEPDAYLSNSFSSVAPDAFSFRAGVTTMVDVGSSGWKNFEVFKSQTIDRSQTRVLAFLNIVGLGMKGGQVEQNLEDMNAEKTAEMARKYPDLVAGIKVAHYSGPEWDPVDRAVVAGNLAKIPVMIDFGGHIPQLSLETLLLEKLRPGDIFTHAYAKVRGRTSLVDDNGQIREYVKTARKRGIIFDVGHGGGSFLFSQAIPAMEQGFWPNSISTDLHTGSMNGGMKDMINVMSKFLNMKMPIEDIIRSSTWEPARIIHHEELGNLDEGAVADLAILSVIQGNFGFVDASGWKMDGNSKLVAELTIREGKVVWDLNGISRPDWKTQNTK